MERTIGWTARLSRAEHCLPAQLGGIFGEGQIPSCRLWIGYLGRMGRWRVIVRGRGVAESGLPQQVADMLEPSKSIELENGSCVGSWGHFEKGLMESTLTLDSLSTPLY